MHCVCISWTVLRAFIFPPDLSPLLLLSLSLSFSPCPPTHTEVAQWRANRILTPAKRGRKPGSGKKNIVKAASGKPAYVNLDMSQYSVGTVLLQVREVLCEEVVGSSMG